MRRPLKGFLGAIFPSPRDDIAEDIRRILHVQSTQNKLMEKIMHTLEETLALVTDQKTRIDGLVALTTDLHQRVIDALGGSLTPSQQMRVDAIFDGVKENADEVDAAITANTVSATAGAVSDGPSASDIKSSINNPTTTNPTTGTPQVDNSSRQADGAPAAQ